MYAKRENTEILQKKKRKKNHFQTINLLHFSMIPVMNKICVIFTAELKVIDEKNKNQKKKSQANN